MSDQIKSFQELLSKIQESVADVGEPPNLDEALSQSFKESFLESLDKAEQYVNEWDVHEKQAYILVVNDHRPVQIDLNLAKLGIAIPLPAESILDFQPISHEIALNLSVRLSEEINLPFSPRDSRTVCREYLMGVRQSFLMDFAARGVSA